jgi:hypothetical protein
MKAFTAKTAMKDPFIAPPTARYEAGAPRGTYVTAGSPVLVIVFPVRIPAV